MKSNENLNQTLLAATWSRFDRLFDFSDQVAGQNMFDPWVMETVNVTVKLKSATLNNHQTNQQTK